MKRIRGGSGLGDSVYVRAAAEHVIGLGEDVTVCSDYPELFLGSGAQVEKFSRDRIDILAHYTNGKTNLATTQWQDVCATARVEAPLEITWHVQNHRLIEDVMLMSKGKPVVLVHGGREPMDRPDKFGHELLPKESAFTNAVAGMHDCFTVAVGKSPKIYPVRTDYDLTDATSVSDLIDLFFACDRVVTQCGFAIPLCEALDKPVLAIWSLTGLQSNKPYIKTITPQKVLSKKTSYFVMDDLPGEIIKRRADDFRHF